MTYKVGCKTSASEPWTYNALRFGTTEEAETYGADLFGRWLALEAYEIHESAEPANYIMGHDGLKRIGECKHCDLDSIDLAHDLGIKDLTSPFGDEY
jgi:hypothetical protein